MCRVRIPEFTLGASNCSELSTHPNRKLKNAFNKYGEVSFEFEPIIYCTESDLLIQEQWAIDAFSACKCGYNIALKADKPPANKGVKKSPEHSHKVSQSLIGKKLSDSHKEALCKGWDKRRAHGLGTHTEAFKVAVGNQFRGCKQSEEWKQKKDAANRLAAKLQNPEWRRWLGRKGAAIQNGRTFIEPEPPRHLSKGELQNG